MDRAKALLAAARKLSRTLEKLRFGAPVTHVYNPLVYAARTHAQYVERYGDSKKSVVYLGMNPGPFGMAQTGVPFGEVSLVRDFLGVSGRVDKPEREHPARPIDGFACKRSEVSGARLWGTLAARYPKADAFFERAFVANYCPLVFMEESGRNRTPDKLSRDERDALYAACDEHLRAVIDALEPKHVIGIGKFAEGRAEAALAGHKLIIGTMPHPSPASPAANRDWAGQVDRALAKLGLTL
ncbi:MAG TPA: uracil-DNA glycosylase family protein [Polyangiales bacterium]|jgi:single-strand selective monofunctional uracil DNA glycosylase|nr:uracil-DNA glycosylase family protein [Polyangiales bacterium]